MKNWKRRGETIRERNIIILGCPESVFHSQTCFYNNASSYKRGTKSVKYRGVYLNRRKWIVRNLTK